MDSVNVPIGKYVVAVSGGIDSMVLLDVLAQQPELELVVAHYEHGIRNDSDVDLQLVAAAADRYGLTLVYERGQLGPGASEAAAREARYDFLRRAAAACQAKAILTAHHRDDLLETAILNIIRGTGRRGLSSLGSNGEVIRPFLHVSKRDIQQYAVAHHIEWREDSTNADDRYLRNYVRHKIVERLGDNGKQLLLEYIEHAARANPIIDAMLLEDIRAHITDNQLQRHWFIMLPYDVSREVMAAWLRSHKRQFDKRMIDRLVVAAKVAQPGKKSDIDAAYWLETGKTSLKLRHRSSS